MDTVFYNYLSRKPLKISPNVVDIKHNFNSFSTEPEPPEKLSSNMFYRKPSFYEEYKKTRDDF